MALQRHSGAALNLQSRIKGAGCAEETRQLMLIGCCWTPALQLWFPPAEREVIPSITERHEVLRSFYNVQLISFFFHFPVIGNRLGTSSGRLMNNSPPSEKQMSNYVVLMVFTQPVILSNLQPSHPKGEKSPSQELAGVESLISLPRSLLEVWPLRCREYIGVSSYWLANLQINCSLDEIIVFGNM